MEVFLTGGTGVLGTELIKQSKDINFVAPNSKDCNIINEKSVLDNIEKFKGKVVLHAAASTNVTAIENDFIDACEINICGTFNILKACQRYKKKLIFISQEMGREINTIGSKANHFETQQRVVEMKTSLEKIKEQLLNVL